MKTGFITKKLGMSSLFSANGDREAVTLLQMEETNVVAHMTEEKHGYNAVQVAYGKISEVNAKKPHKAYFQKINQPLKRKLKEYRVENFEDLDVGSAIAIDSLSEGAYVDLTSVSKGKGFAGAMKRHNFSGLRATHGVSISHRSHGSTGHCQDPGRVFKGKKMAGQMGNKQVTVQNIEVLKIDSDKNIIFVKGAVPGAKQSTVFIKQAVKKNKGQK